MIALPAFEVRSLSARSRSRARVRLLPRWGERVVAHACVESDRSIDRGGGAAGRRGGGRWWSTPHLVVEVPLARELSARRVERVPEPDEQERAERKDQHAGRRVVHVDHLRRGVRPLAVHLAATTRRRRNGRRTRAGEGGAGGGVARRGVALYKEDDARSRRRARPDAARAAIANVLEVWTVGARHLCRTARACTQRRARTQRRGAV